MNKDFSRSIRILRSTYIRIHRSSVRSSWLPFQQQTAPTRSHIRVPQIESLRFLYDAKPISHSRSLIGGDVLDRPRLAAPCLSHVIYAVVRRRGERTCTGAPRACIAKRLTIVTNCQRDRAFLSVYKTGIRRWMFGGNDIVASRITDGEFSEEDCLPCYRPQLGRLASCTMGLHLCFVRINHCFQADPCTYPNSSNFADR